MINELPFVQNVEPQLVPGLGHHNQEECIEYHEGESMDNAEDSNRVLPSMANGLLHLSEAKDGSVDSEDATD